ncbi:S15/NS1 RNA-binding domain-containing protein [Ramicandelaber brevisporus]|nr:S15/NS1 RNA-binding domain-containing protein [Ramicandelaber brevisporus]
MAIIEDIPAPSPPVHAPSHFSNLQPSLKSGLETVTGNLSLFSRGAVQSVHATSSTPSVDSNGEIEHSGLDTKTGRGYQFGLTSSEAEFLFDLAPQTIVQQINPLATGLDVDAIVANGGKLPGSTGELHPSYVQAEQVRKIASLENSNGSEIRKWNVSRAVEMFGMKAGDTGSPEVQAAVFTIRINAMADHLRTNKKDTQSRYRYTLFLQKRKRILKYLKRQSLERYFTTLKMLGLEPEAVENRINPPPKNIEMVH